MAALLLLGIVVLSLQAAAHDLPPKSGWLYVVDSKNNGPEAQVLVVDPDEERVVHSFQTGNRPTRLSPMTGRGDRIWDTCDTERNAFLPERASVPSCVSSTLVPGLQRENLYVICGQTQDVRLLTIDDRGGQPEQISPAPILTSGPQGGRLACRAVDSTPAAFWSFTIGREGSRLYAIDSQALDRRQGRRASIFSLTP